MISKYWNLLLAAFLLCHKQGYIRSDATSVSHFITQMRRSATTVLSDNRIGAYITEGISIAIQNRWTFHFDFLKIGQP